MQIHINNKTAYECFDEATLSDLGYRVITIDVIPKTEPEISHSIENNTITVLFHGQDDGNEIVFDWEKELLSDAFVCNVSLNGVDLSRLNISTELREQIEYQATKIEDYYNSDEYASAIRWDKEEDKTKI